MPDMSNEILVKQKAVLSELCDDPDCSDEVKRVVKAYSPTAKRYQTNLKALDRFTDIVLEEAALFFGGKPRTEDGKEKRYRDKASLIDWLIMAIESLFPQFCEACENDYVIKRCEKSRFNCGSCGAGSHNCTLIQEQPLCSIPGFKWICHMCCKKHTLEKFVGSSGEFASPPKSAASEASDDALRRRFSFMSEVGDTKPDNQQQAPGRKIDPVKESDEDKKKDDNKTIPVCRHYLQNRCKYGRYGTKKIDGVSCQKSHPPMCRRYCAHGSLKKYGCQRGKECRYYHPPICHSSQFSHECYKKDCRFQHLKNTRRVPVNENFNPSTYISSGVGRVETKYDRDTEIPRSQIPSGSLNDTREPPRLDDSFLERLFGRMEARMNQMLDKKFECMETIRPTQSQHGHWRDR
jgi:hypothetical protein